MQIEKVDLPETHSFSPFFLSYIGGKDDLKPFYNRFPRIENFEGQIKDKTSFPESTRKTLVKTLTKQYKNVSITDSVRENIQSLESANTFTVTTGHQLNIFTGPLYFILKIITVINACRELRKKFPEQHFVPVYWMASEDHDFEEISYFRLYGKKYTWATDQKGAVGRFSTKGLELILNELPGDSRIFHDAYLKSENLSEAVRTYVNALFGKDGIVIVDADDRALKHLLQPVMEADILGQLVKENVEEDTKKLQGLGYETQVNARDINFFYLADGIRERIEKDGAGFKVVENEIRWTQSEIQGLIEREPEKFSPNVILRPLYQEIILPNLAYVGGPSEVVYWLQLKSVFQQFNVPFPILMPRNFGLVMEAPVFRKFEKTDLEFTDLFEDKNYLYNHWTLQHTTHDLSLSEIIEKTQGLFESVRAKTNIIDITLTQLVDAKRKQTIHQLEVIEKKMLRAEKRRHTEKLAQIASIKETLFPNGSLQERTDNFLNFYQSNPGFLDDLANSLDPFDYRMHMLIYA